MPRAAIWWVRTDLRLDDNPALAAALASGLPVQAVFVVEPALWSPERTGPHRAAFLAGALRDVHARLGALGGGLRVATGEPGPVLGALAQALDGAPVFATRGHSAASGRREDAVGRASELVTVPPAFAAPPGAITRADGTPFTSFAPFERRWAERLDALPPALAPPARGRVLPGDLAALDAFAHQGEGAAFPATGAEAHRRLSAFTQGHGAPVYRYAQQRDRFDGGGGAALSPYLRFGLVSGVQVLRAGLAARDTAPDESAREGVEAWLRENAWREHTAAQLAAWGHLTHANHDPAFDRIRWREDPEGLEAWRAGRTGYPAVDAAMRELAATGWLSNRARMLAASFLTKHLLVDWRVGALHFHRLLVDAEPASNALGWQHIAGTGPGAQPWFRVLNPLTQADRFDPSGAWRARWVPEAGTPDAAAPVVEHRMARERAIATYRSALRV